MSQSIDVLFLARDVEAATPLGTALEDTAPPINVDVVAEDLDEASDRLDKTPPDCVILDFGLAALDPVETLETVREWTPIPAAVGIIDDHGLSVGAALDAGVDDVVHRHDGRVDPSVLAQRVDRCVELRRRTRQSDRFREAVEHAGHAVMITDADGTIEYVNPAFEAISGYDASEAIGADPSLLQSGEHDDVFYRDLWETITGGAVWEGEVVNRTKDGDRNVIHQTVAPIDDADGQPGAFVAVNRDVTDRRAMEADLRRERDRFRALFENISEPVVEVVFDDDPADPVVRDANPAFEALFGFDRNVIAGEPLDDLIVPPGREEEASKINASVYEAAAATDQPVRRATADGVRDFLLTIAAVDSADDREHRYGIYTDVTELKERERELAAARRKYRALVEAAPDAILLADAETGRIVEANEAAAALLDRPVEDLVGLHQSELHPSDRPGAYRDLFERHVASSDAVMRELADGSDIEVETTDGDRIPVEINAKVIELDDRTLIQGIFRDVTERRERERQLERQNESLEEFASVVSHDLRNPLNVAAGSLELYEDVGDTAHLERAQTAIGRTFDIVEDVLRLARQGRTVDETETASLEALARDAWRTVETSHATLEVAGNATVQVDASRARQLLENLFRNAVEHGDSPVSVRVAPTSDGFFVADDGPGIPAEDREQVLESGYTTAETGTGFGLAIVQRIAAAHGWDVDVGSSETGGARFTFSGVEVVSRATVGEEA